MNVNPTHIRHVREALTREFSGHIDLDDVDSRPDSEREQAFRSRALAALALRDQAGCETIQAAFGVIDGQDDQGIDAIAVNETSARMWVVQAKWSDKGKAGLDLNATLKLKRGIDLILNQEYGRFNLRFQQLADQIDRTIAMAGVKVTVVIALLGQPELATEIKEELDRYCTEMNYAYPMLNVVVLGLGEFYRTVLSGIAEPKIDLEARVERWSQLTEPYLAYYGTMATNDISQWYTEHGDQLFAKNIRRSLGLTEVNVALVETLLDHPQHFWYFNNGITILCESIEKTGRYGRSSEIGEFRLNGASVVNGAQTVAGISEAVRRNPQDAPGGWVWVRFISLQNCPEGFGIEITKATNTQNQVNSRDFVALDPTQARLREDFALSLGLSYVLKRGEPEPRPDQGCAVVEAAMALACAHRDSGAVARAKQGSAILWEDPTYHSLFDQNVSAKGVWRSVQLLRVVRKCLNDLQAEREGRASAIAKHGDLLTVHIVAQGVDLDQIHTTDDSEDGELGKASKLTPTVLDWLIHHVDKQFGTNSYVGTVFTRPDRCRALTEHVLRELRSGRDVPELPEHYQPPKPEPRTRLPDAVKVIVDAGRLANGTPLEFRPGTGPERRILLPWIAEDSQRARATWTNNRNKPLRWAADGALYSPSRLVMHMLKLAGMPTKAVQGTTRWFVRDEGSLADLSAELREEEATMSDK